MVQKMARPWPSVFSQTAALLGMTQALPEKRGDMLVIKGRRRSCAPRVVTERCGYFEANAVDETCGPVYAELEPNRLHKFRPRQGVENAHACRISEHPEDLSQAFDGARSSSTSEY